MPATNVKSEWVAGNLVFYDKSRNIIATWDGTNRRLTLPDSSVVALGTDADATISFDGTNVIISPLAAGGILHIGDAADTAANEVHIFDGGTNKASRLVLYDQAGLPTYLWVDATGDLRTVQTTAPSNDTSGTVVGGQS